jgi:hypothetical protein
MGYFDGDVSGPSLKKQVPRRQKKGARNDKIK